MGIGFFPPRRRVIIEKFNIKKDKSEKKGIYKLEFTDFKYTESFIVDSVSSIESTINYSSITDPYNFRVEWKPVSFRIIECIGPCVGERFSSWVDSYMFNEYYSKAKPCSVKIVKIYDDGSEENKNWVLHGCFPVSLKEESGLVTIELAINHGHFNW